MNYDAMSSCPPSTCCSDIESPLDLPLSKTDVDEELALLAKAVGHSARVKILKLLSRKNTICGEIVGNMDLAQSTVSQHLKVLKNAGLIRGNIERTATCYCLNIDGFNRLKELIKDL